MTGSAADDHPEQAAASASPAACEFIAPALAAAVAGTGALAAAGAVQAGSPWAAFNTLGRVVVGGDAGQTPRYQSPSSLVGLGINFWGLAGWGCLYRSLFRRVRLPTSLLAGATAGLALYLLDYHAAPPRFRPGFERYLTWTAIAVKYAAIGLALAVVPPPAPREPGVKER